ncbi:ubiquitin ligase (cullin) of SCF [Coemansia sp. RSA 2704]|nr:ubiquitin ligase (cullin) of SCF [Coemansia sp. RSA 2704]
MTWSSIEPVLDGLVDGCGDRRAYLAAYAQIAEELDAPTAAAAQQRYHNISASLVEYVDRRLDGVRARLLQTMDSQSLLRGYTEQWAQFRRWSRPVAGLFRRLDVDWTQVERRTRPELPSVPELLLQRWCRMVGGPLGCRLAAALRQALDWGDTDAVAALRVAYAELAPDSASLLSRQLSDAPDVYRDYYEQPCIERIVGRIQEQVRRHSAAPDAHIAAVRRLLAAEARAAAEYLDPASVDTLRREAMLQLIVHYLRDAENAHAPRLDGCGPINIDAAFVQLHARATGAARRSLDGIFTSCIRADTLDALPSPDSGSAALHACRVVEQLARVRRLYDAVIRHCFDDACELQSAFTRAFTRLLADPQAVRACAGESLERVLVRYLHMVLHDRGAQMVPGLAGCERQAVRSIKTAQLLVPLCRDKMAFYSQYALHLARRLLAGAWIPLEQAAVEILADKPAPMLPADEPAPAADLRSTPELDTAEAVRAAYIAEFGRMLSDVVVSQDLTQAFSRNIDIKVLALAAWPAPLISAAATAAHSALPAAQPLCDLCDAFAAQYESRNAYRRLQWQWAWARATVQLVFPASATRSAERGYTLVLNLGQLAILSLFTEDEDPELVLTRPQIAIRSGLPLNQANAELDTLIRARILLFSGEHIQLNAGFSERRRLIDIAHKTRAVRQRQEDAAYDAAVASSRVMYLQADIAAMLKRHQTLSFGELHRRIADRRQEFFAVRLPEFRLAVEKLIDRQIIERDADDVRRLSYML